ncbi:hypothetical protein PHMEG_0009162 [Phytophthora megakarya]|uniref:Uncharacterized protein n=1 Tax=Phytophthora megakarya TaxID=4795 RepID=A0A225WJC7_9STRA|nr:hypothetical protein PHMEG_0009162 [Phytophthora megakarya]
MPNSCRHPLIVWRARCRTTSPLAFCFRTNTHLLVNIFFPFGRSTSSQVLFLINSAYSVYNAFFHWSTSGDRSASWTLCGSNNKFTA